MPQETCPYCQKPIEVPYGDNIPCPECGGKIDVFDPAKRNAGSSINRGFKIRQFSDQSHSGTQLQEGRTGSRLAPANISYKDIGGLDEVIEELDILVNGSIKYPELWNRLGGKQARGVLLTGPPGCGKTLLIQALANESKRKISLVQAAEIKGWRQGASEGNLVAAYEAARPSGIFVIDEIDAIGGKRDQAVNEVNISITSTLNSILDGARYKDDNVIVIGTTNRPYALDDSLRRPGRFDLEIEVPPPSVEGRKKIFEIHTKTMPLAKDVDLAVLAQKAHGFTGADIAGLCSALSKELLKRCSRQLTEGIPEPEVAEKALVSQADFSALVDKTVPSLLRGVSSEVSTASWEDIGGLIEVKKELQRLIIWPVRYRSLMESLKMRLPKGMLLHGPPGCGKTLLARAIAGEIDYNFLVINGPSLISMWAGKTEEAIRDLFWRARLAKPCIIFIDEIESIASIRGRNLDSGVSDRTVDQLLTEIDGVLSLSGVFVIGATNRIDLVDPALRRPGRLDLEYEISLPDEDSRRQIFEINFRGVPADNLNLEVISGLTSGYSGADIEWTCTIAKKFAAERYINSPESGEPKLTQPDILKAIEEVGKRK